MIFPRRVHLLGIGGVGMGALAGLFRAAGVEVTGSEAGPVYPPMSLLLEELKIPVYEGYRRENLDQAQPELVVIGNVIRRENEEAQAVFSRRIPYLSLPEALYAFFLRGKRSLVVAGTHGKTTTSSLLAFALEKLGADPTFLVGGLLRDRNRNFRFGRGPYVVLEGDEYDSAFFDKRPKFIHYAPYAAILTSVEFDHADIYPDFTALKEAFRDFLALLPEEGLLLVAEEPGAQEVAPASSAPPYSYGPNGLFRLSQRTPLSSPPGQRVRVVWPSGEAEFFLPLIGAHNAENALAVFGLLVELGFTPQEVCQALESFPGVKRRQEILLENPVTVIDDFAHHPTAVRVTLGAVRETWPERRVIALFEPRTNTSRRRLFQEAYAQALSLADKVLLKAPPQLEKVPVEERLDLEKLSRDLLASGTPAQAFLETNALWSALLEDLRPKDVVLFMSNGPFDGLPERLARYLKEHDLS